MYSQKNIQTNFYNFTSSTDFSTTQGNLNTALEAGFVPNPFYSCSCRRGYSLYNDPFNPFKRQETPEDCSRGQIAKIYRLGKWF